MHLPTPFVRISLGFVLGLLLLLAALSHAQGLTDAPESQQTPARAIVDEPHTSWLPLEPRIELGTLAALLAVDGWQTRSQCASGCVEHNPLSRPFVSSNAGMSAYMSLSLASSTSANWLLRHHPRWRRAYNLGMIGWEVGAVAFNLAQRR